MIKEEAKNILFDKTVRLMPVPRDGVMISDPKHVGFFMYEDTKVRFVLPKSRSKRTLFPILTPTEQEFFEDVLGMDLSIFAKVDNFWKTFEVVIEKNETFMKFGIMFNLADPMDNLKWRLLKIQPQVAPSWEEKYDSGEYRFALVESDHEEAAKVSRATMNEKAYKFLSKISNSPVKLYDFLSIYQLQNPKNKRPAIDADRDALFADAENLITENVKAFMNVAEDPEYDTKLLIHRGIGCGAIEKKINSKDYFTPEGKFLGNNIEQVIKNLRTPEYQEDYIKIKAVVSANSENKK
jgi:hypothetical protein